METDEYQAKLAALGVDRGKLASGFGEHDPGPPGEEPKQEPVVTAGATENIGEKAKKSRRVDESPRPQIVAEVNPVTPPVAKRRGRPPKIRSGVSLPAKPSPPPAPAPPEENEEQIVQWHLLTEDEIGKIAVAVITGNGGRAHEDDIISAVEELTRNQVSSMLCTLVLRGEVKISCHNKEVLYHGPSYVGTDWDYVI